MTFVLRTTRRCFVVCGKENEDSSTQFFLKGLSFVTDDEKRTGAQDETLFLFM